MLDQIITFISAETFFTSAISNIDVLAGVVDKYISGMSNVRLVSYLLMLLAFIVFLFLVIVIYVKSIIAFLKFDKNKNKKNAPVDDDDDDDDEPLETDDGPDNFLVKQKELSQQKENELELLRQRHLLDQQNELQRQQQRQAELLRQQKEAEEQKSNAEKEKTKKFDIDLDWEKGKVIEDKFENVIDIKQENLTYKQSYKTLPELVGLIINMIARNVDDLKIAQTIMFRNQGKSSEDEILQTIAEIKNLLALTVNKKFDPLREKFQLPDNQTTLYHLIEGDTSYALASLEALMDTQIETASTLSNGEKKDIIFKETANMACTFGTIAALNDTRLATGAFELAIELSPQNANAWNRVGDMYKKAGSNTQAIKAYQNVLSLADENINASQVANAHKMLSQFYYEQGNNLQAAKLYNDSKLFYDSLGINRNLDRQELEIVNIIEQKQNIDEIVQTLLNAQNMQYSYAL